MKKNIAISINNLSKKYEGATEKSLNDLNFFVEEGKIHGLVGSNGSGKTTLMNIISGLIRKYEGFFLVEGKDGKINPEFNTNLGYAEAEPVFGVGDKTAEEYVLECCELRGVPRNVVEIKLTNSPINEIKKKKCSSLSTGWKKMLQIFTLKTCEFKLLILDEPLNGLDPFRRKEIITYLTNFRKEGGTILISTHLLFDLQKIADDITVIEKGKIMYSGNMKNLSIEDLYMKISEDKPYKSF
jgi:ABC-2 type transport system ATP-binding protein